MDLGVYNVSIRLNKIYILVDQMLLNLSAKLTNVSHFQITNFLYPNTVIIPVCFFPLLSHI
jgi:hypothetical protein